MGIGLAVLFAGVAACDEDPTGNGGNGGGNISDPATLQTVMEQVFLPFTIGVLDGFDRLLVAIDGGAMDGVVITPLGLNNFVADVLVDLDGDGSRESTISGGASGDIQLGANIGITSIDNPNEPTFMAVTNAIVTETGPTTVMLDGIGGTLSADPPGSGNAASVVLQGGTVSLDLLTGNPSGSVNCVVSGEGESIDVLSTFQSDGAGGWEVRFTGNGFDFTVP
jgi:hypothetical protein